MTASLLPASADRLTSRRHRLWVICLLVFGAILCGIYCPFSVDFVSRLISNNGDEARQLMYEDLLGQIGILAIAAGIALTPGARRSVLRLFDRINAGAPRSRMMAAVIVLSVSAIYLYSTARLQGRTLLPMIHDEQQYRLETSILASGHLALPAHPRADFFETFYVFTKPVYASMYFLGTALLNVPGVWLHLPYWLIPLLIASAGAALLYLVIAELIDGVAGIIAVVVLLSLPTFRWFSVMEMSHPTTFFWAILLMWVWLRWRQSGRLTWLMLGGVVAGWFAITRPLDAACAVAPVAVFWGMDLFHRFPACRAVFGIATAILLAIPFVAIQLSFDRQVTGHWLTSPMSAYHQRYFNLDGLGLPHYDPNFRPPTQLPQMQAFYEDFIVAQLLPYTTWGGAIRQMFSYRLPLLVGVTLPCSLLLILMPVGVLGLTDRRRLALWIVMPLFMAVMCFYFLFIDHYCAVFIPGAILMLLLGMSVVGRAWPHNGAARVFVSLAVLLLPILSFPEINRRPTEAQPHPLMRINYLVIPKRVELPAIVLFHYSPRSNYQDEPVYNWDVARPDDATIIRAHDLGEQENRALFRYYAQKDPERTVYLYDRGRQTLTRLGRVKDLASGEPGSAPAPVALPR